MTINPTTTTTVLLRISSNPVLSFHSIITPQTNISFVSNRSGGEAITLRCRCIRSSSNNSEQGAGNLKDVLSGMVEERVGELFNNNENSLLVDGLEEATLRVEIAKRELADFDARQIQTKQAKQYINYLQAKASEIEECEREIIEARAMVEEAERALKSGGLTETEIEAINKNEDRLESIKAGGIAGVAGTLAGLPFSFIQATSTSHLVLPTAITFLSCALFGVTFRYAVRKDLDDFHLKTGTAAAFGLVKGLAMLDGGPPLELEVDSLLAHASSAAIYVSQSLLIFLFASVALEYCIKLRFLSSFPIDR